ncbi:MAG: hypothetical protein ACOC6M_00230, partial [Halobacteriota archaeon]
GVNPSTVPEDSHYPTQAIGYWAHQYNIKIGKFVYKYSGFDGECRILMLAVLVLAVCVRAGIGIA